MTKTTEKQALVEADGPIIHIIDGGIEDWLRADLVVSVSGADEDEPAFVVYDGKSKEGPTDITLEEVPVEDFVAAWKAALKAGR